MLTALEKGVKGGQWFSLIDKVWDEKNLWAAFRRVKANQGSAGIDHIRIKDFEEKGEENINLNSPSFLYTRISGGLDQWFSG